MRELKFRAWQDNQMLVSNVNSNYRFAKFFGYLYEDDKIMQFTGLQDKHGKEVYEGDLCIINGNICVVRFDIFFICGWEFKILKGVGCYSFANVVKNMKSKNSCTDFEVIGNIHENPELL